MLPQLPQRLELLFKIQGLNPQSGFYIIYLTAMEDSGFYPIFDALTTAAESDAPLVFARSILISANVAVLPLLLLIASERKSLLIHALIFEILLDQGYVVTSLVGSSGTALKTGVFEHLGFLVPHIMTSFTINGFHNVEKRSLPIRLRGLRQGAIAGSLLATALLFTWRLGIQRGRPLQRGSETLPHVCIQNGIGRTGFSMARDVVILILNISSAVTW